MGNQEREKNRAPDENQVDYQTVCVLYANWLRAVFGFLGARTDEVGTADATALVGFTRIVAAFQSHSGRYSRLLELLSHPRELQPSRWPSEPSLQPRAISGRA